MLMRMEFELRESIRVILRAADHIAGILALAIETQIQFRLGPIVKTLSALIF